MRSGSSEDLATFLGVLAILFWGALFAVSGSLATEIGALTASALAYLIGGALGLAPLLWSRSQRRNLLGMRPAYVLICGGLFVAYNAFLFQSIGLATDSQQVLEISVLNYLWPTFTLLFSIPVLKARAKPMLAVGLCAAFAGALLALGKGKNFQWEQFQHNLETNWAPYLLALGAAVAWGLYSALTRRLARNSKGNAVPLFILASGLVLLWMSAGRVETHHWSARALGELAFLAIFPTLLAFLFWDISMRRGRVVLVVALSYFTPVLSLLVSSFYLKTSAGPSLWLGSLLVTVGAVICNYSLKEPASPAS